MGHSFPVALPQCETGRGSPTVESCATVICLQENSFFVSKNRGRHVKGEREKAGREIPLLHSKPKQSKGKGRQGYRWQLLHTLHSWCFASFPSPSEATANNQSHPYSPTRTLTEIRGLIHSKNWTQTNQCAYYGQIRL